MGFWAVWKASRLRRQRVEGYLTHLVGEPDAALLRWLTLRAGSADAARRELVFSRRAIGLIVAERDALDDRTAADVAHELEPVVGAEARRDAGAGRLWAERWRAYTAALAVRGNPESPAARLARVLLSGVGITEPTADDLQRTTAYVHDTRAYLNEQLRLAFGAVSLPDDVRPSALQG